MLVTKQLMVAIDFHSMEKIQRRSMATIKCLVTNILQNIFFWVNDDHFHLLVTFPFNNNIVMIKCFFFPSLMWRGILKHTHARTHTHKHTHNGRRVFEKTD